MIKEPPPLVMDSFSEAELALLDEKLASLSLLELTSYIAAAKGSLQNQALASTWRPRIEIGMERAQEALLRGEAAAAAEAALPTSDDTVDVAAQGAAVKKPRKKSVAKVAEPAEEPEPEPEPEEG